MKRSLDKAAQCGEPSYIWRAGQERRLQMILEAADKLLEGSTLENGCGVGTYVEHLAPHAKFIVGMEYEINRVQEAYRVGLSHANAAILCASGEELPFPGETFSMILSHEVLEHVHDDRIAVREMVRVLQTGGRILIFTPNRGYPFETHGIYWRGQYVFGNIPLVNYLPRRLRDLLAPHVRIYGRQDLERLFDGLPVSYAKRTIIFGGYDNIIARWPIVGKMLRAILQWMEHTPLQVFGLSHFWIVEKTRLS
jgi:SAM-dependent methyltransferase